MFAKTALSGFYLDPHVGINAFGDAKLAGRTFDHTQLEFGSKIGWHSGYTQFGLDFSLLYPTYKAQDSTQTTESYSGFQYGLFMGARYSWVRGWFSWVIAATQTGDINLEKYKGTGFELGVSLGPQNMINFFAKIQLLQFRTREDSQGIVTDLSNGQELETKALIIGFDIPFNASGAKK
ncbi:MAG: hypothetical protein CME70_01115 [Halobacteriovorax sp.]|nr:hypothetical protein [Halobacteriovorax sp.]|tara:strand:+ start:75767 stop:76303 length:537 start_codon:yes stop_codon:yes gene_type:complete